MRWLPITALTCIGLCITLIARAFFALPGSEPPLLPGSRMLNLRAQTQRASVRSGAAGGSGQAQQTLQPSARDQRQAGVPRSAMQMPPMLYGTAWKKDRTAALVELAVRTGFRGIDTACQPKHYHEPGVGVALGKLLKEGVVKREELYLQTKYTPLSGQDPNNIPYNRSAPLQQQVQQSFQVSLKNLGTDYLDSLVLHSPLPTLEQTLEVWRAMEAIHRAGGALRLGISNCYDLPTLQALHAQAEIKPAVVQNRFHRETGYGVGIRDFCKQHNTTYQSFWTLTANPTIVNSPTVNSIASKHGRTKAQVWFRFVMSQGITFLTGTSSQQHMQEDLAVPGFELEAGEVEAIARLLK